MRGYGGLVGSSISPLYGPGHLCGETVKRMRLRARGTSVDARSASAPISCFKTAPRPRAAEVGFANIRGGAVRFATCTGRHSATVPQSHRMLNLLIFGCARNRKNSLQIGYTRRFRADLRCRTNDKSLWLQALSLERAAGIEPATLAWKARALPLCNARIAIGDRLRATRQSSDRACRQRGGQGWI